MRPLALTLFLPLALTACNNTWWNPPLTSGFSPHLPVTDSDNMRRVMGQAAATAALEPEPGDIWPGPLPEMPTLRIGDSPSGIGGPADQPNFATSRPTPMAPGDSITPRGSAPAANPSAPIVVPNGNGTSTVIHPDGRIETIPTSR